MPDISAEATAKAASILEAQGGALGKNIHSWSCEDKESCTCVMDTVADMVEAIEPLFRADERGKVHATIQAGEIPAGLYAEMIHDERERLRAQVAALQTRVVVGVWSGEVVFLADVLGLLGGESDG